MPHGNGGEQIYQISISLQKLSKQNEVGHLMSYPCRAGHSFSNRYSLVKLTLIFR